MATNTDSPTDDEQRGNRFSGEYNAFGNMGRTTSDPDTLVWLRGHDGMKFGIHHPSQYGAREVFGWLVNNVLSVPFGEVESHALDVEAQMAIQLSPDLEPQFLPASEVFEDA